MEHQAVLYTFGRLPIQLWAHDGVQGGIVGDIGMRWSRASRLEPEIANRWESVGEVGERLSAGGVSLSLDRTLLCLQGNHRGLC